MTHQYAIDTMASERYLLGEMDEPERDQFEEHYFECMDCAEDIRAAGRMREEVRRAGPVATVVSTLPPALPAGRVIRPMVPAWRQAQVAVPWAAAACLAVVAGYQSLVVVPGLEQAAAPQAVTPFVLHGATRAAGGDVVVTVPASGRSVALSLDVIAGAATKDLSFELRGPGGNALVSGRTPVPAAGVPLLLLLVPAEKLDVPARYSVQVRDAASPQVVLGEYAFVTSR